MAKVTIPTNRIKAGSRHKLWWVSWPEASGSLVRREGVWSFVTSPTHVEVLTADRVLVGGFDNEVDEVTAAELTAAGFGGWLS